MQPVRKPFEAHLYNKFDNPAKQKLIDILLSEGHSLVKVKENYYADVETELDGIIHYSEAEVKTGWKEEWPDTWYEIRIPERKSRLLAKYGLNINFYVFSNDLSQCWRIKGSQMTEDTLREAKGRYIRAGELFFHIPYKDAELIRLGV